MIKQPKAGGYLAIDWGQKKVGLATADAGGLVVTPQRVLRRDPAAQKWLLNKNDLAALAPLCEEWEIGNLVLGLPLQRGGRASDESEAARKFAVQLEAKLKRPVFLVDEHLSSWEARQQRGPQGEDAQAAALFLRDFFENLKREQS